VDGKALSYAVNDKPGKPVESRQNLKGIVMDEPTLLEDPAVELEVRAAILIAAAAGIMEHLKEFEPAKHTRRYRMLDKMAERLVGLFDLYPLVWEYDLVNLGQDFFDKEHDARLRAMLKRGLQVVPPEAPDGLKKLVLTERWKRGDILYLNGDTIIIHSVLPDEYHYVKGPALLYSSTNYPMNPFLRSWKRIAQLGEDCTDDDIRHHVLAR
jgi:hypothetical protein